MEKKECFVCHKVKPLSEFYKNENMKDGHYNKCKECYKAYSNKHREENIDRARAYDRARAHLEKRKVLRREVTARRRREVVGYQKAHNAVIRAIANGTITRPKVCDVCGKHARIEAHHEDYGKPFMIVWLCPECHHVYHRGKNKRAEEVRKKVKEVWEKL